MRSGTSSTAAWKISSWRISCSISVFKLRQGQARPTVQEPQGLQMTVIHRHCRHHAYRKQVREFDTHVSGQAAPADQLFDVKFSVHPAPLSVVR